ncbi:aspartate carbamoyltransferase catalytic subunit [Nitratiruptor sp. SB155-2]|uniref:Aspartate carbamoyltransferase catalytic subunit n=1 Tax=Nitratiruptor sp. (strain SB155-2) TaxID=387092 RepID=PYRB_NITSB|nr:aspartate carbamoyltransferase catalytic subunit [Nitratiruptor sp. SB155-2]A6Q1Y1.1 RecName: Full=Aspartate carbamoyltransferase catalytic subunit; AltName: Full=Aspartate transcarbamylase; Short=ATCase [Nitratiruptor sp. SB155-2]BAF69490.1 aspartate carbamoyltransferase, catalytic subunit [Nitratiruptor sp. SB155-2]
MIRHLITTKDFTKDEIEDLFDDAQKFLNEPTPHLLKNKLIITIFFENSTRTRSSFEVAAKRLGAEVVSLDVSKSSTKKGETLFDTAANLNAMEPHAIVVRHKSAGVPYILSKYVSCSLINGGDGAHAHPTQALLDLFTLKQHFKAVEGKKIAIVGDIKNSRVANSNIELLQRFGMKVILVAPPHFLPKTDLPISYDLHAIINEVDAIMSLRTQTERHKYPIYASLRDYGNDFCITKDLIKDKDLIILHPGPVHRNIDISDEVLTDPRCKVLEQVKNGVAVRMAVLKKLIMHG